MGAGSTPRPRPLARRRALTRAPPGTLRACAPARGGAPARAPPARETRRWRSCGHYHLLWGDSGLPWIPHDKFMRIHGAFKFWDHKHLVASAKGIDDLTVKVRRDGSVR